MKGDPRIDPNLPGMPLGAATKFPVSPGPGVCPYHKRHENTRLLIFQLSFKISKIFSLKKSVDRAKFYLGNNFSTVKAIQ